MLRKLAEPARPPRPRKVPHRQHASCPNECRDVYLCGEIHPDQGVLPFSEMRWVGTNKWTKLTKAGHPGWARRANGDLLWVRYTAGRGQEVTDWCNENCTGRYHIEIKHTMVCFQNSRDATLARLMFER